MFLATPQAKGKAQFKPDLKTQISQEDDKERVMLGATFENYLSMTQ